MFKANIVATMILAAVLGLAAAGCGKDSSSSSAGKTSEHAGQTAAFETEKVIAELTAHKEKVCACPDRDCAMQAGEAAAAFESEVRTKFPNPTAEQLTAFRTIAGELKDCLRAH